MSGSRRRKRLAGAIAKEAPDVAAAHEVHGLACYRLGHVQAGGPLARGGVRPAPRPVDHAGHRRLLPSARALVVGRSGLARDPEMSPSHEVLAEGRIVAAGALADQGDLRGAIAVMEPATKRAKTVRDHHFGSTTCSATCYDRVGDPIAARRWFADRRRGRSGVRRRRSTPAHARSLNRGHRYHRPMPSMQFRAGVVAVVTNGRAGHGVRTQRRARRVATARRAASTSARRPKPRRGVSCSEETGLGPDQVELVAEYPAVDALRVAVRVARRRATSFGGHRLGQAQRWFMFRVRDDTVEPTPDGVEFCTWRWVEPRLAHRPGRRVPAAGL